MILLIPNPTYVQCFLNHGTSKLKINILFFSSSYHCFSAVKYFRIFSFTFLCLYLTHSNTECSPFCISLLYGYFLFKPLSNISKSVFFLKVAIGKIFFIELQKVISNSEARHFLFLFFYLLPIFLLSFFLHYLLPNILSFLLLFLFFSPLLPPLFIPPSLPPSSILWLPTSPGNLKKITILINFLESKNNKMEE